MTEQRKNTPWWMEEFDKRFVKEVETTSWDHEAMKEVKRKNKHLFFENSPHDVKDFISYVESQTRIRMAERVRSNGVCRSCNGSGQEIVGENRVTKDMAIDAGDMSMEGSHHSFVYDRCSECYGTGIDPVCEDIANKFFKDVLSLLPLNSDNGK